MAGQFQDILDECIDRLKDGESLESCLAKYSGQAAELEPLLWVALRAREFTQIEPRPEFKAELRYKWLSASTQLVKQRVSPFGWLKRWATVAAALLFILLISGGTVIASANSLPGERLYPVKGVLERIQLSLARSDAAKAHLRLFLAQRRLSEVEKIWMHHPWASLGALKAMGDHTDYIAEHLQSLGEKREAAQKLADLTIRQEQVINRMMEKAPPNVKPALEKALEKAEQNRQKALEVLDKSSSGHKAPGPHR